MLTTQRIYKTTNLVNGKFYIGKDQGGKYNYLGSGSVLRLAIKKYGRENFLNETIEEVSDRSKLNEREIHWIEKFDAYRRPDCYNISTGGEGGKDTLTHHPNIVEIKKKMSKSQLEWQKNGRTEEHKRNLSLSINRNGPRVLTEEWKQKISKSMPKRQKLQTCPKCGMSGGNNMKRYHFDKCDNHNGHLKQLWVESQVGV